VRFPPDFVGVGAGVLFQKSGRFTRGRQRSDDPAAVPNLGTVLFGHHLGRSGKRIIISRVGCQLHTGKMVLSVENEDTI
jgi:hypothetical protein